MRYVLLFALIFFGGVYGLSHRGDILSPPMNLTVGVFAAGPNVPMFPGCTGEGCDGFDEVRQDIRDGLASIRVWKVDKAAQTQLGYYDTLEGTMKAAAESASLHQNDLNIIMITAAGIIYMGRYGRLSNYNIRNTMIVCQTAPGQGVQMWRGKWTPNSVRNYLIRYCKFRGGVGTNIGLGGGSYNAVIDHNSMSWAGDQGGNYTGVQALDVRDYTISANLIVGGQPRVATAGSGSPRSDPPVSRSSSHRNLYMGPGYRLPTMGAESLLIANNVTYGGTGNRYTQAASNTVIDWISNWVEHGKAGWQSRAFALGDACSQESELVGDGFCMKSIYAFGNATNDNNYVATTHIDQEWGGSNATIWCRFFPERYRYTDSPGICENGDAGTRWDTVNYNDWDNSPEWDIPTKRPTPLGQAWKTYPVQIETMDQDLRDEILDDVGANKLLTCAGQLVFIRDRLDSSRVNWARSPDPTVGPGSKLGFVPVNAVNWADSIMLGSWKGYTGDSIPLAPYAAWCADTDDDGMPDEFEMMCSGSNTALDREEDISGDGYFNIEEYLNGTNWSPKVLTWTDNSDGELGFEIWRQDPDTEVPPELIGSVGPNITTYTDEDSEIGLVYMVRAYDGSGSSDFTNQAQAICR